MKNNPLISVIIPIYNPGEHLVKCLESVIHQTYYQLQIIIINDGSTDKSSEICNNYAKQDSRIIYLEQQNSGVSTARNLGISVATGDYLHFLDSDDYLELDTYEYVLKLFHKHQCDIISFEYYITFSQHETRHLLRDNYYGLCTTKEAHYRILTGVPFVCNKILSKHLINHNFNEQIFRGEDTLFTHQIIENSQSVWFDKRPLYHYVQSEESAVRGKFRVNQLSALHLYKEYKDLFFLKYFDLYKIHLVNMAHLVIGLYYDMHVDTIDHSKNQKMIYQQYCQYFKRTIVIANITTKIKIKLYLFRISPKFFCIVHKKMHHL